MTAAKTDSQKKDIHAVERVLDGDGEVYRILIQRYQAAVFYYTLLMCGEPEQAQKLVGEGFRQAFKNIPEIEDRGYFLPFLLKNLRSKVLTSLTEMPDQPLQTLQAQILLEGLEDRQVSKNVLSAVRDGLMKLSPILRELWIFRFVLDLDAEQVRYILGGGEPGQIAQRTRESARRLEELAHTTLDEKSPQQHEKPAPQPESEGQPENPPSRETPAEVDQPDQQQPSSKKTASPQTRPEVPSELEDPSRPVEQQARPTSSPEAEPQEPKVGGEGEPTTSGADKREETSPSRSDSNQQTAEQAGEPVSPEEVSPGEKPSQPSEEETLEEETPEEETSEEKKPGSTDEELAPPGLWGED